MEGNSENLSAIPTQEVTEEDNPRLFPLFQKGFGVEVQTGVSISELFMDQWKWSREFVDEKISIVFLNSQPVDDLGSACIDSGSVLALSTKMPGLAGITMRREGVLASFRGSISYRPSVLVARKQHGWITVKLFNHLMRDLGPHFLRKGILVEHQDWSPVLSAGTGAETMKLRLIFKPAPVPG